MQEDSDGDGYGDSCDACDYHLVELPIYGRGRVGIAMPDININTDLPPDSIYTRRVGQKFYELTDHLGNVRATLSDRKGAATPGSAPYHANIRSYNHPYPFGLYSITRNDWIAAEYLEPGEELQTAYGSIILATNTRKLGTERVYNLKVETDECYFVSEERVLSHNTNPCAAGGGSIFSHISPKITSQMERRGWIKELIRQTVNNSHTARVATNRVAGNSATAYYKKVGLI